MKDCSKKVQYNWEDEYKLRDVFVLLIRRLTWSHNYYDYARKWYQNVDDFLSLDGFFENQESQDNSKQGIEIVNSLGNAHWDVPEGKPLKCQTKIT